MRDEHLVRNWAPILGEVKERDAKLGSPILGAFLFHQWAASRLEPEVRAHYGEFFVLGAHHLLSDHFPSLSAVRKLLYRKPKRGVSLACSTCRCDTNDVRAECLSRRFCNAHESINSMVIAEWCIGLFVPDAINVRAFFRFAAPSDGKRSE